MNIAKQLIAIKNEVGKHKEAEENRVKSSGDTGSAKYFELCDLQKQLSRIISKVAGMEYVGQLPTDMSKSSLKRIKTQANPLENRDLNSGAVAGIVGVGE